MVIFSVHATLSARAFLLFRSNGLRSLTFCLSYSSSAASVSTDKLSRKKWRQPVLSALEVGGVKISKEDVPDNIFSKLGMQLHRRDEHPIGILKNAIYEYFDAKFNKFHELCPIVSVKQGEGLQWFYLRVCETRSYL